MPAKSLTTEQFFFTIYYFKYMDQQKVFMSYYNADTTNKSQVYLFHVVTINYACFFFRII